VCSYTGTNKKEPAEIVVGEKKRVRSTHTIYTHKNQQQQPKRINNQTKQKQKIGAETVKPN
jgi:hypothetical protein